jgi:hypothetical protein
LNALDAFFFQRFKGYQKLSPATIRFAALEGQRIIENRPPNLGCATQQEAEDNLFCYAQGGTSGLQGIATNHYY